MGSQIASLLLAGGAALALQQSQPPVRVEDSPAQATHAGVTVAMLPVLDTPVAEAVFGPVAAPTRAGFLPVELLLTNRRETPVEVNLEEVVVIDGSNRYEQADPKTISYGLYPLPEQEVEDPSRPRRVPLPTPIPVPRRGKKPAEDKSREDREEAEASLRSRQLRSALLGPGGTARGFLYFNVRGRSVDVRAAVLYLPEVRDQVTGRKLPAFDLSFQPFALEE